MTFFYEINDKKIFAGMGNRMGSYLLGKGGFIDVNDYCRSVEIELHAWKAKMYDVVRNIDKLRAADKEKISLQTEELHKNISEMENIIKQLQTECPVGFSAQKKKVDEPQAEMKKKYEDAMAAILQF